MLRFAKRLSDRFIGWLQPQKGEGPPRITEHTSVMELAVHYPHASEFLERKYGVRPTAEERAMPLSRFVKHFGLPPAQVLFMEIQMVGRTSAREMSARDAAAFLDRTPHAAVLDVREKWETTVAHLPRSRPLDPDLLAEVLTTWDRATPILCYCHFGVRSLDAASFLTDRGFREVYTLRGGIDAWSIDVDPNVKRYDGHYC